MTKFTKEHYEEVAQVLKNMQGKPGISEISRMYLIQNLADMFKADNSNFSYALFFKATNYLELPIPDILAEGEQDYWNNGYSWAQAHLQEHKPSLVRKYEEHWLRGYFTAVYGALHKFIKGESSSEEDHQ